MATTKKLMGTTAVGGAELLAIEDVFSTYLYAGNSSTQTITNGIDLAGEGGLVWLKGRSNAFNHFLFDTERGATNSISSNTTATQTSSSNYLTAFNAGGFTVGDNIDLNGSGLTFASWTFRKAPRFFDCIKYTGTSADQTINHNLGTEVGAIFIKSLDSSRNWWCTHRGLNGGTSWWQYDIHLNETSAEGTEAFYAFISEPSSTSFTLRGGKSEVNANGETYVAYLFAHDPLGPSGDGSDGLIACGSLTLTSGNVTSVDLGWEPQWLLVKKSSSTQNWQLFDNMRGFLYGFDGTNSRVLYPNTNAAEANLQASPLSDGFALDANNWGAGDYIYIAIRRGPMRQPTSGTEVFDVALGTVTYTHTTGFPVDLAIQATRATTIIHRPYDRLRGGGLYLETSTNVSDQSGGTASFDNNTGYTNYAATLNAVDWMFRRAPGFFDVVAYTGDGVAGRTVPHNLKATPEMMIIKRRDSAREWVVYHSATGNTGKLVLNNNEAVGTDSWFASTDPTDTYFVVGGNVQVNATSATYIAYLLASLDGVSKVGSYTGNGTSQTINCGFTSGARFVLIKRTDSTGDWYVWDTERGIVAANDPHLSLNTTAAEVTTDDSVDPDNSGFIVNQVAATNINVSSASYIFYAVS